MHPVSPWGTPVSKDCESTLQMLGLTPIRPKEVTRPGTRGTSTRSLSRTDPGTKASADRDKPGMPSLCNNICVPPFVLYFHVAARRLLRRYLNICRYPMLCHESEIGYSPARTRLPMRRLNSGLPPSLSAGDRLLCPFKRSVGVIDDAIRMYTGGYIPGGLLRRGAGEVVAVCLSLLQSGLVGQLLCNGHAEARVLPTSGIP